MNRLERRLLREYIKESIVVSEVDLAGFAKTAGDFLGFGGGSGSTVDKWFSNFLDRQLDAVGEKADEWIGQKLGEILPDSVLTKIDQYAKKTGESSASNVLTKITSGWIEETEEALDKEFSNQQKKQIYQFATDEYAAIIKKDPDLKKASSLVKRKLDLQFGALLTKSEKSKSEK